MAGMSSELKKLAKEEGRRRQEITRSLDHAPASKLPPLVLALANISLSNEQEKDECVEISGLTNMRFCTSPENLASALSAMVGDTLKYPSDEKRDLVQQFSVYFEAIGWKTEDYMTVSAGISLPMLDNLVPNENVVGIISPAINLTLQHIAQFIVTVIRQKLYLSKSTTFNKLLDYHASNRISNQRITDAAALGQGYIPTGGDQKVPVFSGPKFVGNSLEGQAFLDKAMRKI